MSDATNHTILNDSPPPLDSAAAESDDPTSTLLPPTAAPLAQKVDDLYEMRAVVIDAAGVSLGLWLSYVFVLFYFFVATSGVTHRDLLLENPVKLPFMNVDLPLSSFFWAAPALVLLVHTYVMLHMVMLAGKMGSFDAELSRQLESDKDLRTRARRQLPSNLFVMLLAGPREIRDGLIGFFLKAIAWSSLVVFPVLLLVFIQLQFLPYHDGLITGWQRACVAIDVLLLWKFWPRIMRGNTIGSEERSVPWGTLVLMTYLTLVTSALIFLDGTFPGEWWQDRLDRLGLPHSPLHDVLFNGKRDPVFIESPGFFSDHLVLPFVDVIDHAKFDTEEKIMLVPYTVSLRGRHLEGAVIANAFMQKVDLTGAHLDGAVLDGAQLQHASMNSVHLETACLRHAEMTAVTLDGSYLNWALLDNAVLEGASLAVVHLQGASFKNANLKNVKFLSTNGPSSSFDKDVESASFDQANGANKKLLCDVH